MFPDADAVQVQVARIVRYGDKAEVRRPSADIADQNDVAGANLGTPVLSGLRGPCVESRERFLDQNGLAEAGRFRRLRGQVFCHIIEGGGYGQHHQYVGQSNILTLRLHGLEETFLDMFKIAAGAVECGQFPFLDLRLPRKVPLPGVDMRVRQPRLRRGDEAIWNKRAMIAREMANNRAITVRGLPWQRKRIFGKLFGMRYVKRGRQRRLFTDLIRSNDLGEFDDFRRPPSTFAIAIALLLVPRSMPRLN